MARQHTTPSQATTAGLLGVGFDHDDGHQRITRGDALTLVGGSAETHERMQDVALHVAAALASKGKRLQDAEPHEVFDLLARALER